MVVSKLLLVLLLSNTILPAVTSFTAMFSFGDSVIDTGNEAILTDTCWGGRFPYGETYFGHPTGRASNGRLIVDFFAEALGLPFQPPYMARQTGQQNFRRGVNFAVGGATAVSRDFLIKKGIVINWPDYPLGTQIQWFTELLPSLCSSKSEIRTLWPLGLTTSSKVRFDTSWILYLQLIFSPIKVWALCDCFDCDDLLSNSLFLVGEFGGNDYANPFAQNRTALDLIQNYVPSVIDATISAINVLLELGTKTLVVPGIFPLGCLPRFLVPFSSNKTDYYTETCCIKWLNEFAEFHNRLFKHELDKLRRQHTKTTIIYGDYYEAAMRMYRFPTKFGFKKALDACCGVRGPYNYNYPTICGNKGFNYLCDDPSRYICWDGTHLTEAAYKIVADGLLKGPYADPAILTLSSVKSTDLLNGVVNPVVEDRDSLGLAT